MNREAERKEAVRAWLATEGANSLVRRAARSVLHTARQKGYSLTFVGFDPVTSIDDKAFLEDIESQINVYILENRRGIQEKILLSGQKAGWVLQHGFLQDWIDASRRKESDPWRYLYKRALEVMRGCPEFSTTGGRDERMVYSLAEGSKFIPEPSEEDIGCIGLPEAMGHSTAYDNLKKAETILAIARHFWNQLSAQWGKKPIWVPVRSLINWISLHVDLSHPRGVNPPQNQHNPLENVPAEQPLRESLLFNEEMVKLWAGKFAASLDKNEALAFVLHCGDGLTLAEIAGRLGYSGASGVSYLIERAKEKLKHFVRDLPWLSPPDLSVEAWNLFVNKAFSDLKKNSLKP